MRNGMGAGNGLVYAITLRVVDSVGGVTHATFAVRVPRDQSGVPAIEDAPVMTVLGTCP